MENPNGRPVSNGGVPNGNSNQATSLPRIDPYEITRTPQANPAPQQAQVRTNQQAYSQQRPPAGNQHYSNETASYSGSAYQTQPSAANQMPQQPTIIIQNNNEMAQTQVTNTQPGVVKSKWVAFWLCFFLGALGAHQFYCGWKTKGIIMLCLGLSMVGCFITVPWAIFDLFKILFGSFPVKNGLPV